MEFEHEFIVADHITAEAILGLDILEGNKCVVDLCNKQMSIQDKVIPLQSSPANTVAKCIEVTVMETINVPANSEMEIIAHVDSTDYGTWLVEGTDCPILVARAVVTPHQGVVPVRIINTERTLVTLYRNMKIGIAEPISDVSICKAADGNEPNDSPHRPPEGKAEVTLSHPLPDDITEE